MQAKAFNPQIFLEFLCYSVFAGSILFLINSGKYLSYVTPRMEPYLYFSAIVMVIWAFAALFRMFRPQHKIRSAHCFVLVIPILLLFLPHSPLSVSDFSGNYVGGNVFSGLSGKSASITGEENSLSAETGPLDGASDSFDAAVPDMDLSGLDTAGKRLTVSNDDFGDWISEIYLNRERYQGYTVVITGFVFRDLELLNENEFIPARLMMSCCVADLMPAGLICKYDNASQLKAESWVTVEGTLFIGTYEYEGIEYEDPQINVTKITPANAVEGYVYAY